MSLAAIIIIIVLAILAIAFFVSFFHLLRERENLENRVTTLSHENASLRTNSINDIVDTLDIRGSILRSSVDLGREAADRIAENVSELAQHYISLEISNRFGELSSEQETAVIREKLEQAKKAVSQE